MIAGKGVRLVLQVPCHSSHGLNIGTPNKVADVARDQRQIFGERGRCKEAVHCGQRDAGSVALRHQVSPMLGDFLIDREDAVGEACRQLVCEPNG